MSHFALEVSRVHQRLTDIIVTSTPTTLHRQSNVAHRTPTRLTNTFRHTFVLHGCSMTPKQLSQKMNATKKEMSVRVRIASCLRLAAYLFSKWTFLFSRRDHVQHARCGSLCRRRRHTTWFLSIPARSPPSHLPSL